MKVFAAAARRLSSAGWLASCPTTLTSTLIKDQFNGTGAQTAFPTSFVFWDAGDLEVIHTDAGNVETIWARGTQYTATGGGGATGTVMVSTTPTDYTPASGTRLTIRSALPNTQPTSLPAGGPFPSAAVEQRFDQNVRLIQQLAEEVTRTIQLAVTSTSSGVVIPEPEASKFLRWDALADNLENADVTAAGAIGIPVTVAEGGTGADLSGLAAGALVKMNSGQTAFEAAVADTDFMKAGGKGADIASASPLVLGADGNYFDVTGTAGFSAITVTAGRFFMLQFDGALTLTHGAFLDLPGAADITTVVGDSLIGLATAADTVDVLSYSRASGLPVIGESLSRNFIAGLECSKSTADVLALAAGEARDATNAQNMTLGAFTKDVSAAWAVGTGNGALDTGTYAASTLYYIWLIKRSDTGVVDVLTSVSGTAPTMPTNYDFKRLIGAFVTDSGPDIIDFQQVGDYFRYIGDVVTDLSDTVTSGTFETAALSVPRHCLAHIYAHATVAANSAGGVARVHVRTASAADVASNIEAWDVDLDNNSGHQITGSIGQVLVDASSQVDYTAQFATGSPTVTIQTLGFTMLTRSNPI